MIMRNGQREQVKDLSDILRIVSENIGVELDKKYYEIAKERIEDNQ